MRRPWESRSTARWASMTPNREHCGAERSSRWRVAPLTTTSGALASSSSLQGVDHASGKDSLEDNREEDNREEDNREEDNREEDGEESLGEESRDEGHEESACEEDHEEDDRENGAREKGGEEVRPQEDVDRAQGSAGGRATEHGGGGPLPVRAPHPEAAGPSGVEAGATAASLGCGNPGSKRHGGRPASRRAGG